MLRRDNEMAKKKRDYTLESLERSTESLQENVSGSGAIAGASYTLVGAIILLGGIGYGLDRWRDTSPWFLIGGLLLGIVVGFYELIKTVSNK